MKPIIIDGAHDIGVMFADNPHRMVGQDGAFSIPRFSRCAGAQPNVDNWVHGADRGAGGVGGCPETRAARGAT